MSDELNEKEIERLKKLLEIFPRDADIEDAAELIQNAKAIVRVAALVKYAINIVTVAGAVLVAWWQFRTGSTAK